MASEVAKPNSVTKTDKVSRENLLAFENKIKEIEGSFVGDSDFCPLKHSFSDGVYVREIFIPEGTFISGKIHKHRHPNFLLTGEVFVVTEGEGEEHLVGPRSMMSKAGTKRSLYAITDLVWTTIHHNPTNTQDLDELEKIVIAQDFEEYDKFILTDKRPLSRLKRGLIKLLSK